MIFKDKSPKAKIFSLLVLTMTVCGIYFAFTYKTARYASQSITLLSPNGGESWLIGSTQTIKWGSQNLPSGNKIAVNIRRIPPPPLQNEGREFEPIGQEFDPIIFTNLENTGSVDWHISNTYPPGNYYLRVRSYSITPEGSDYSDVNDRPFSMVSSAAAQPTETLIGGAKDFHGCMGAAGYSWCDAKSTCIRSWEEYCTSAAPKTVLFVCDNNVQITATFYIKDDKFVDLKISDGRNMSVPRAMSGSGARYANADESFVFWNKGDTAFVEENGVTTITGCVLK